VKNYGQLESPIRALAVSSREDKQPVGDSRPGPKRGRETRGMRANNKNKHPRSEARAHMGLRNHVSAGTSLSVDRFPFSITVRRPSSLHAIEGG